MGIIAYGVKLKNNEEWKTAFWEDIEEDFNESDIIPESNYFYKSWYNNKFHRFISDEVLKEEDFSFYGDPCCSREILNKTVNSLGLWIEKNPEKDYEDKETFVNHIDIISKEKIKDLFKFLKILNENGCVMWFAD